MQTESSLPVHLFKDSFKPFLLLLNEHKIQYRIQSQRSGIQAGPGGVLEIIQAVGAASIWASLASVIVAYINSQRSRKVIITMKDNTVVHAEGLTLKELEQVLGRTKSLTALDAKNADEEQP